MWGCGLLVPFLDSENGALVKVRIGSLEASDRVAVQTRVG